MQAFANAASIPPATRFLSVSCTQFHRRDCSSVTPKLRRTRPPRPDFLAHAESSSNDQSQIDSSHAQQFITQYWHIASTGQYSKLLPFFADDAVYHDGLYPWPVVGVRKLSRFLTEVETIFPPGTRLIVDGIIANGLTASASWHAQAASGKKIPLSKGISWYQLCRQTDESGVSKILIKEAWEHVEPTIKFGVVIPLVSRIGAFFKSLKKKNRTGSVNS